MKQYDSNSDGQDETYQVIVTNISWSPTRVRNFKSKYSEKRELPDSTSYDFTGQRLERLMKLAGRETAFKNEIERTVYETLTYRYGYEVAGAQIWLPLEDK